MVIKEGCMNDWAKPARRVGLTSTYTQQEVRLLSSNSVKAFVTLSLKPPPPPPGKAFGDLVVRDDLTIQTKTYQSYFFVCLYKKKNSKLLNLSNYWTSLQQSLRTLCHSCWILWRNSLLLQYNTQLIIPFLNKIRPSHSCTFWICRNCPY